jgi:hypothetical protein
MQFHYVSEHDTELQSRHIMRPWSTHTYWGKHGACKRKLTETVGYGSPPIDLPPRKLENTTELHARTHARARAHTHTHTSRAIKQRCSDWPEMGQRSRYSTTSQAGQPTNRDSIPGSGQRCVFSEASRLTFGPTQPPIQRHQRRFPRG